MRFAAALVRDALARLVRSPVASLVSVLIVAAGTVAIFATTGLALAGQQRTLAVLNSPEGRLITVTDTTGGAALRPASVERLSSLPGVEWAPSCRPG